MTPRHIGRTLPSGRLRLELAVGVTLALAAAFAVAAHSANSRDAASTEFAPTIEREVPGSGSPGPVPAASVPRPVPQAIAGSNPELGVHFSGLNFQDQRTADGGSQFSLEPPDQGLCVGSGSVVETVNDILAVYDTNGTKLSGPIALNPFFTNDHAIVRSTPPVFGTFIADPKCYYDPAAQRFFLTALTIARDSRTGAFTGHTDVRIAVSKTSTPTASPSDWTFTTIDTTNDGSNGTPDHDGCPCLGDQPLIGADANGFYVTTNEFSLFGDEFNGAQIYALSKADLVAGDPTPTIQRIEGTPLPSSYGNGPPYSLQPATSPSSSDFVTANNGTEYLLGALEFGKFPFSLDNRIAVWALTNTGSLDTATPDVHFDDVVVTSQVYGLPPNIQQKNGPLPLAAATKQSQESLIDGGDDRMQTAVWAAGRLWGAGDTVVKTPQDTTQVGITWYSLIPSVTRTGQVSATVANHGYVSVEGNSVTRPAIAMNPSGSGAIVFTLAGKDHYPSAAYTTLSSSGTGSVHVAAAGTKPADGFSGYKVFGNAGVERWGDYSAGAVDPATGKLWLATEWIEGNVGFPFLANWNTSVFQLNP